MLKTSKSFGLIETLTACTILIMVAGGAITLSTMNFQGNVISEHQTEAENLAQEMIETVKGVVEAQNDQWSSEFWDDDSNIDGDNNEFSEIKSNFENNCVFINHNTGQLQEADCSSSDLGLKFTRNLEKEDVSSSLSLDSEQAYKITAEVTWSDYGRDRSVSISSYLTDWQPRY